MDPTHQHYHRCLNPECQESWLCQRVNCGLDEHCDACERQLFEDYMDRRGFTVSQPTIPELEETADESK